MTIEIADGRRAAATGAAASACVACGGTAYAPAVDFGLLPIAHRMPARADEIEERFAFRLVTCAGCGLLQNKHAVDPTILYAGFNYNFSSWKIEPHCDDELDLIFSRVQPADAIDVGCNDGRFMQALAERGVSRVVGVEPNPVPAGIAAARGFHVVEASATPTSAANIVAQFGKFDLAVCRQVVEHIPDLATFFAALRAIVKPGGHLFVAVPNMLPALIAGDCSVLWEEHVYYFVQSNLAQTLRAHGFEPVEFRAYNFSGGSLAVLARRIEAGVIERIAGESQDAQTLRYATLAASYGERVAAYGERLRAMLMAAREQNYRTVIYGVGVRACMAVNALQLGPLLDFAVDDQPERQGKYMPGAKLQIRPRQALAEEDVPTICLLAVNNENDAAVGARIAALGMPRCEIVTLCAPGPIHEDIARCEAVLANH